MLLAAVLLFAVSCTVAAPRGATVFEGGCGDVLLVSGRGSDAPIDSPEVRAIERELATALATVDDHSAPARHTVVEAVELGDLDRDGLLDPGGYPAVAAADAAGIDLGAEPEAGDLVMAGGWNDSRRIGTEEFVRLIGARSVVCPGERIVVAGYSMGATAVGVGLRELSPAVLDRVDAVVLFGDPTTTPGPWLRSPGATGVGGLLGSRSPYVPDVLRSRTAAWCGTGDPYCTGNPLLFLLGRLVSCELPGIAELCANGHDDYPTRAIPAAMREVATALAPL